MVDAAVEYERYGLTLLLVDAAVLVTSIVAQEPGATIVGYELSGPLVHVMHGNSKGSLHSLAIRNLLPAGAFLIGNAIDDSGCSEEACFFPYGAFLGGMLGAGAALVLDWAVLAKKPVQTPRAADQTVAPTLALDRDRIVFNLAGTF